MQSLILHSRQLNYQTETVLSERRKMPFGGGAGRLFFQIADFLQQSYVGLNRNHNFD